MAGTDDHEPTDGSSPLRREQFERLFREHSRAILAYAWRRVDLGEDAADVLAETMLVAWRRLDDIPPADEARLWLFGVARRVLANQRRGGSRRRLLGIRLRDELTTRVRPDAFDASDSGLEIREAIACLPSDDREILRLSAWEGLRAGEIGVVLSVPPATVRTRLFRARRRLRARLEDRQLQNGRDQAARASTGTTTNGLPRPDM